MIGIYLYACPFRGGCRLTNKTLLYYRIKKSGK
jgi:hypothetical protein